MLFDEIESKHEYNSFETTAQPVLRSSLAGPYYKRQDRTWSPLNLTSAGRQRYRLSTDDSRLIDKVVRTSVNGHNIFKPFKTRHSVDEVV
jgi:hypothetical protein